MARSAPHAPHLRVRVIEHPDGTMPGGMHGRSNAARLLPRAARPPRGRNRVRRPAIRAPADGRTDWFAGRAGPRHPGGGRHPARTGGFRAYCRARRRWRPPGWTASSGVEAAPCNGVPSERRRGRRRRILLVLACLALGCTRTTNEVVLQGPTMGTYYRVRAIAETGDREAIRGLVEERLNAVDRAMSTYRDDSEISRFNRLAAGESFVFSEETWAVLELAWRVREESGGTFDPTAGPLVDAWGFGAPGRDAEPMPPGEDELTRLRLGVGAVELSSEDRRVLKLVAHAALDLSAIAKGWAVDRVFEDLTNAGYSNHLVEVGGEVRTAGHSGAGDPWAHRHRAPAGAIRRLRRLRWRRAERDAAARPATGPGVHRRSPGHLGRLPEPLGTGRRALLPHDRPPHRPAGRTRPSPRPACSTKPAPSPTPTRPP